MELVYWIQGVTIGAVLFAYMHDNFFVSDAVLHDQLYTNKHRHGIMCFLYPSYLFDLTQPSKPIVTSRQRAIKTGAPLDAVRTALYAWRRSVKSELYLRAMWTAQGFFMTQPASSCLLLGQLNKTKEQLVQLNESIWARWDVLGKKLFNMMVSLDIPQPAGSGKRTSKAQKRPEESLEGPGPASPSPAKRTRPSVSRTTKQSVSSGRSRAPPIHV